MWGGLTSGAAEDNNVCRNPYQKEKEANVNLFDLSGEIAVVIGGTGVLGGAITEGLAMAGAKAAILGDEGKSQG